MIAAKDQTTVHAHICSPVRTCIGSESLTGALQEDVCIEVDNIAGSHNRGPSHLCRHLPAEDYISGGNSSWASWGTVKC